MKRFIPRKSVVLILPIVLLMACSNPADDVAEAQVHNNNGSSSTAVKTAQESSGDSIVYAFTENSTIDFVGSKVTGSHDGGFKKFLGEFKVSNGDPTTAVGAIEIDMNSTWTDTDRLTGHLKTPDFFDVSNNPTTTFILSKVEKADDDYTVTGDLTLRGVTKTISFPAKIALNDKLATLQAEFFIKRFDFNIKYPGKANDLIRDEVVIKLDLKATPAA